MDKPFLEMEVKGLDEIIEKLDQFFDPSVPNPSPLGKAVAAAARDVYLNMQRLVPVNTDGTAKDPGLLKQSVYRYWDPKKSPNGHNITYQIGVNMKKAPHFHLADAGHDFYANYNPFKLFDHYKKYVPAGKTAAWFGSPLISRNKTGPNGKEDLGRVIGDAKPRPYLDESFSPTVINKALQKIQDVYFEQFKQITGM